MAATHFASMTWTKQFRQKKGAALLNLADERHLPCKAEEQRGIEERRGRGRVPLTCGGEERSCQVMRVRESREDSWGRRPTEQVKLPVHVQFVRIQLHLLRGSTETGTLNPDRQ